MVCPACSAENEARRKFCSECGTALVRTCGTCGTANASSAKFCGECGALLPGIDAPASAPVRAVVEATPTAELRVVSVLFVDLVGYTALSEARDAEDVRELLGRYFETVRTVVGRYGGTVEKFIGDAVMAVWGVPIAREDDAERAVRAGLDLVDAVAAFGAEFDVAALRARAGVVTGQVASLAHPGEGLVVGDRVNTAARVQAIADPGTVYVDDVTRQVTAAAIAYEDAGRHEVKGKAEPLHLWRAVRVVAGVAGTQRENALEPPFVGRDADLRLVKDLFHQGIDRGASRLLAVSGPAGAGKSRLRWEFEKYSDGLLDDILWHSGRCLSYGDGVAYWALAEMIRQRLGLPEEAPAEEAAGRLAAALERWIPDSGERAYLAPRLGSILGIGEPGLTREELFAGWRLFFERLSAHAPVVLVFEDLQWADEGLLDFIEHLLEWSAQHRIFLLTLARPELAERREGWPGGRRGATVLYLERLGDDDIATLLDELVSGLPPDARDRIVAQAEGIPLYAVETVRALADRGVLERGDDGQLSVAGDVGELDVPPSLSSLLSARLDALEPDARELVKAMSIFGGGFPRSAVAALSDVPPERLDAALASLVRRDIFAIRADPLSPDRGQYTFAQGLLRTVAYEMLGRRERRPRHLAAAEHLRAAFPDEGEDVAEVIAAHLLDAYHASTGDADADELRVDALEAMRRAAQRAAELGAPAAAERAYRAAIDLAADDSETADLLTAAGRAADQAGRPATAVELFEAAGDVHRSVGRDQEAARLVVDLAPALADAGHVEEATERCRAALEELDEKDAAELHVVLGQMLQTVDPGAAIRELDRGMALAEAAGRTDVVGRAQNAFANALGDLGRFEQARIHYEWAASGRYGERHAQSAQNNLGHLSVMRDLPEAVAKTSAALTEARRLGNRSAEAIATGNALWALIHAGRWGDADQLAAQVRAQTTLDDGPLAALAYGPAAAMGVFRGDVEGARADLETLRALLGDSDLPEDRSMLDGTTGLVLLASGTIDEALVDLVRACERHPGLMGEGFRNAWPHGIDAALAAGDIAVAERLVDLIAEAPPGHVSPFLRAQLARARGRLAAARGEDEQAGAQLAAAVGGLEALGYPYWVAAAHVDLAGWLLARGGDSDEAGRLLDSATATGGRLGAAPLVARAAALREASPALAS